METVTCALWIGAGSLLVVGGGYLLYNWVMNKLADALVSGHISRMPR